VLQQLAAAHDGDRPHHAHRGAGSACTASTCASSAQIVRKKYLTEMDLLRLQKALLMCRMAADSTYLVDKEEPGYSSKLEKIAELLGN
jgi:hypothetical protein